MPRRTAYRWLTGALSFTALAAGSALIIYAFITYEGTPELHIPQPSVTATISGEVRLPDTYTVPAGTTLGDLIQRAGGFLPTAALSDLDFSQRVRPNDTFLIPARCVNINTATAAELQTLPGIGTLRAHDIVNYRTQNGQFENIDALTGVSGIGAATIASIQATDCITTQGE